MAYYGTKLAFVRSILDSGQPLTKGNDSFLTLLWFCMIILFLLGQEQWGYLVCQKGDDLQIVFNPSLQNCTIEGFKIDGARDVYAAFQLLVKPGAYSIARDCPEWSTKETGALVLHALLLRVQMP